MNGGFALLMIDKICAIIIFAITLINIVDAKKEYDKYYIFREYILNTSYIPKEFKCENIESEDKILEKYNLPKIELPKKLEPLENRGIAQINLIAS